MKLSLSCRICEGFLRKEDATMPFQDFATLAAAAGYDAVCMRASQIGVQTPESDVRRAREILDAQNLGVTMVTGDFDIVYNNDQGPQCLRNIDPYLNLAESLGASMLRVCLKTKEDIPAAQMAAARAADRGLHLVHQCHAESLFETLDGIVSTLEDIGHPNFGLVYEAANLEECRQDYGVAAIRRLAPWIRNVYLQNQVVRPDGAITLNTWSHGPISFDVIPIPQQDGINFDSVFQGLKTVGYDGLMTVHQAGPEDGTNESARQTAAETADYLRRLADTI